MAAKWCMFVVLMFHVSGWLVYGLDDLMPNSEYEDRPMSASVPFDCGRPAVGELCLNNGTCYHDNGTCTCPVGYGGYDCSYEEADVLPKCEQCENGGTCLSGEDNKTTCFCPEAYFGERCENRRVFHHCSHDRMAVHITPPGGFLGWVYVLDQEENPECVFDADPQDTFTKELHFDSCGSAAEETNAEGDTLRSFNVIVQFDEMIVTEKDLEFKFVCLLPKSGSEIDDNIVPFEASRSDRPFRRQEVTEELNPVLIGLTTLEDQPLSSPQILGTEVKLNFKLNGGELYDNFRIEQITVTNGQPDPMKQSVDLLVDGCVPRRTFAVTYFGGDPNSEMSMHFRVFKLRYSDLLHFETKVKLCKGDGCNATDCTSSPSYRNELPGPGRHKRDLSSLNTDGDGQKTLTYRAELRVWYPSEEEQASNLPTGILGVPVFVREDHFLDGSSTTGRSLLRCFDNPQFVFVAVGLVAMVIFLLIVVTVMAARRACDCVRNGGTELTPVSKH